jgi:hypothetical protein
MEEARKINIAPLKADFAGKFPGHPLAKILLSEPDTLTGDELLAKTQTWLAFFQRRERK